MGENNFKTDLNARERLRYARLLKSISEIAMRAADALELEDDTQFLLETVQLMFMGQQVMDELAPIVKAAIAAKSEELS